MKPARSEHTSVHQCLDEPLVDADGRESGEIQDLLINRDTGRIDFVRVRVSPGSATRAARTIAVPWSALRPPGDGIDSWQVCVRRSTLEKMARFDARPGS